MNKKEIVALKEKAMKLIVDARALAQKATNEKRAMNAEENVTFDKMFADASSLKEQAKRGEELLSLEDGLSTEPGRRTEEPAGKETAEKGARDSKEYQEAFRNYLGMRGDEIRALSADTPAEGGYFLPTLVSDRIIVALNNLVFIRQFAQVDQIKGANSIGTPAITADPADAEWTGEVGTVGEDSTMAIGSRDLSPKILAKLIKVSMKLLMHSPRVEQIVSDRLAYKFAVTEENKFLNGTGSGQPLGLFYASASGINTDRDVSTDNTATAVTVDGLKNAFYAVPAQYRKRPSFGFIGHRDLFKMVSKLKDGEGQYLWQPSNQVGQPDRLLSAQVFESEYAPNTFTASLYVGLFGDLSFYGICDSMDMSIQRLNELYARNNQIGFIGRKYTDGMPTLSTAFARVKLAAG